MCGTKTLEPMPAYASWRAQASNSSGRASFKQLSTSFQSCRRRDYHKGCQQLTSYKTRSTLPCREEVEVSVLTPPARARFAPRCVKDAVARCESSEEAGRAMRREERANTIVNVCDEREWRGEWSGVEGRKKEGRSEERRVRKDGFSVV